MKLICSEFVETERKESQEARESSSNIPMLDATPLDLNTQVIAGEKDIEVDSTF